MGRTKVVAIRTRRHKRLLGLRDRFFPPAFQINHSAIKAVLYEEESKAFNLLPKNLIKKKKITLFYPGCGIDIVQPLLFCKRFAPEAKEIKIILADFSIDADTVACLMPALTGHNSPIIKRKSQSSSASYTFKNMKLKFVCLKGDILESPLKGLLKGFDIYLERAFELFRKDNRYFMSSILSLLNPQGIAILDSELSRAMNLKKIDIPNESKEIGFYNSLSLYQKN